MNKHTHKLLDKAVDTIEGAEILLDPKFHRWLRIGFDTRLVSDYQVDTNIEAAIVTDMINQAREFLEAAQEYLEKQAGLKPPAQYMEVLWTRATSPL